MNGLEKILAMMQSQYNRNKLFFGTCKQIGGNDLMGHEMIGSHRSRVIFKIKKSKDMKSISRILKIFYNSLIQ